MNCPHCFEQIEERSAFCPHCGARLTELEDPNAVGVAVDPTFGALARANLLRLRGDWNAARDHTVEVLRGYPNSGTAHSLLGDIYADQGMYEEAAQWYRMALDLEPDNAADARKLEHAEAVLRERAAALEGGPSLEDAPERPRRLSPLLLAGWAAAAFLVIVIALGLWINGQRPREEVALTPPNLRSTPAPEGPATEQSETPAETPPNSDAPGLPNTDVEPGVAVPSPPAGQAPTALPPTLAPPVPAPTPAPSAPVIRAEATLMDVLRRPGAWQAAGLAATGVLTDPRQPSATVTLDGTRVDGTATDWMARVHGAALAAGHAVAQADPRLRRVTVRVEMPLRADNEVIRDVAFIGELDHPRQNNAPFDRRWWHPGLAPPQALAGTGATR